VLWDAIVRAIDRPDFEADGAEGTGDDEGIIIASDSAQFGYGGVGCDEWVCEEGTEVEPSQEGGDGDYL
jgi:hypothetical protein